MGCLIKKKLRYTSQHVLERRKGRRDFTVIGYSFGSMVAIELVRKLENEGLSGKLILIDGSPEMLKLIQSQQLASNSDEELQSNVLLGMMDMMSPANSAEVNFHQVYHTYP